MLVTNVEGRILLALRAGPMDYLALVERFNFQSYVAVKKLIDKGMVKRFAEGEYCLTPLGREHCPTRRAEERARHG
ncbi:MAG: hypothetical protein LBE24_10505 [Methylobacillus sp.]|jgi:predicted transcriptional regulator|nr:hypothetical protein [Methylobacillus sp.]